MDRLAQQFGQQFVIDNKAGATGAIGVEAAMQAPKDGYTLLVGPVASMIVVPLMRKTPYVTSRDFVGVARFGANKSGMAIHPSVPANTLKEFIAYVKANPGKVHFGSAGAGSLQHIRGALINQQAGIEMVHVPYKGSAEALQDLLAGHIQVMNEIVVFPHVKAGKLKLLAVLDDRRNPDFPDVPTMKEAGLPDFDVPSWWSLFAPKGTPPDTVAKINKAVVEAAKTPEMTDRLRALGFDRVEDTPEEFDALIRKHEALYARIVTATGVKME
jgi:tripartite-type tricarboxylate transporter receptor subunit TctC